MTSRIKRLRANSLGNNLKDTLVELDPDTYQAFRAFEATGDYADWTLTTDTPNIVKAETLWSGGSRWQDVLHDDILMVTAS